MIAATLDSQLKKEEIATVPSSVLDAIREGIWDYEPQAIESNSFCPTQALPGSTEKLDILAHRLATGLPLWHPEDRRTYEDGFRLEDGSRALSG